MSDKTGRPSILRGGLRDATSSSDGGAEGDVMDLTHLVEELDGNAAPPSLVEDPSRLWRMTSGLHASLLSTSRPLGTAESWQGLAAELAAESRTVSDPKLRSSMLFEAGRILLERLGRKEEGELLLGRSESPLAPLLLRADAEVPDGPEGYGSLASELATLEALAKRTTEKPEVRAAAWVEFGMLCEERTSSHKQALTAYQAALALQPEHPEALQLAAETALHLEDHAQARAALRAVADRATSPRQKACTLLDLASIAPDEAKRLALLEEARAADPQQDQVIRELARCVTATGDLARLGNLYRELAAVTDDPVSASVARHLALLALTDASQPVDDLVLELARTADDSDDASEVLAPLAEVALYVEQRAWEAEAGAQLPEHDVVLPRLARALDDPREQALVRERLARVRLADLKADHAAWPKPRPIESDLRWSALAEQLEEDLRFCLIRLPEHRWVRQALAEVLQYRESHLSLVSHLQEWARTRSAGPGRASILLQLGNVHETMRRDLPRAAEVYELAVAEDPDNPNCLRALGRIYEKMRRWPQAVEALRRQASESSDPPERLAALRRVASLAEQELSDVDLAISALQEVAALDPDDLLTLYQLATLCRKARRPTVLITALQMLVDRVDDDVARTALLVELGEVQELQLKKRAPARQCYERALSLTPGYTPALRALSRLYRDNGDLEDLVGLLDPSVDTVTDPAVLALKAGRVCFEELGDSQRAIESLRTAYETHPDLVPARELLLQMLTATGQIRKAYDLLRSQQPPQSAALAADYHYRLGLLAEATARQEKPKDQRGKPSDLEDAALQHYRAALGQQPDHGLAYERSRRLLIAYHDTANVARLVEHAITADADGVKATHQVHLARLRAAAGDTAGARKAYEEALSTRADDPIVRHELQGLLRQLGDRSSLPALHLRASKDTGDTHLQATLLVEAAELLLSTDAEEDRNVAGEAILSALQVDPGNPYAVRHLERLLSEPGSPFAIKDAVSARAVRAQSEAERAIFYVESAELLERVGAWSQARRAYLAAKSALPNLAPAELGLQRTSSEKRRASAATQTRTSIHVLVAEARDAVVAAARGDAGARATALTRLTEILERDPQNRDAVGLARTLANPPGDPAPVLGLLRKAFGDIADNDLRYELGLFLGERANAPQEAASYYSAASTAKPSGRRALRGLVNTYRQMGDDLRAANATEKLLDLFEPGEPSAVDLRMGLANFLSAKPQTLTRALSHGEVVLQARPDDPRAVGLMVDLLERAKRPADAAELVERLIGRERDRQRLHDLYLRKARLHAATKGGDRAALAAVERAAALAPGNRDTITLLIDQLSKVGDTERVATYLAPVRSALAANIGRGAVSLRDLNLLGKVAAPRNAALSRIARDLMLCLDAKADPTVPVATLADIPTLQKVLTDAASRRSVLAEREPAALHTLLQALDAIVARLPRDFPDVDANASEPMPSNVTAEPLQAWARRLTDALGLRPPRLAAARSHNAALLIQDPLCTIRLGANLWIQGDAAAWHGLLAVAAARSLLGASRSRALSPPNLDLLIAASFEVVDVFNPTTAEPDPQRLRDVVGNLRNTLPRRQRKAVETACQALASHPFDAGVTARATTATDLRVAMVLAGTAGPILSAACLLDGVVGGALKQRVGRSKLARDLMAWMLSDDYLQTRARVVRG
ncbi:MAG: tetratricopeptide repeat protein [Myxococcota bacterium]